MVDTLFCESLVEVLRDSACRQKIGAHISCQSGPHVAVARDHLVRRFLDTNLSWLLMIDSDVVFEPADMLELLQSRDAEHLVVGGTYAGHSNLFGGRSVIEAMRIDEGAALDASDLTGEVIPVDFVGAGFLLVHREVFEALADPEMEPLPWFEEVVLTEFPGVSGGLPIGEDWTFCDRAAGAGYQVWLHTGVRLGHCKRVAVQVPAQDQAGDGQLRRAYEPVWAWPNLRK